MIQQKKAVNPEAHGLKNKTAGHSEVRPAALIRLRVLLEIQWSHLTPYVSCATTSPFWSKRSLFVS